VSGRAQILNGQASAAAESVISTRSESFVETRAATATTDAASDWLCAWCLNHVANEGDRFKFEGKDEFTFLNPDGIRFEIITFSRTLGCQQAGKPTLEYTWFPGHAWSFCHCDRCGQHLGWFYAGQYDFVGLITARLIRAQCIRN
jgi:hypothetical protein